MRVHLLEEQELILNDFVMTKNSISSLLFIACMCLIGASCSKDSDEPEIVVELDVSSQSVTLDNNNRSSVSVSSNTSWTASTTDSWLSCTPAEGNKNQSLTISANSDNTTGAVRTGSVVIKDKSGKKSVTVSVKQNTALGPLEVAVDLMVPFTDGFAVAVRLGKNVKSWYGIVAKKEYAQTVSDSEVINVMKSEYTPNSSIYDVVTYNNGPDYYWYESDTEYCYFSVGVDASGNIGDLVRYNLKTNATNLPLAEITSIKYLTNPQKGWNAKISLKNGATKFYIYSTQSLDAYNYDDHYIAYLAYRNLVVGGGTPTDIVDGVVNYTNSQVVMCTWAVNSSGKVGNYSIARGSTSSSARSISAQSAPEIITSEVCPQVLCNVRRKGRI